MDPGDGRKGEATGLWKSLVLALAKMPLKGSSAWSIASAWIASKGPLAWHCSLRRNYSPSQTWTALKCEKQNSFFPPSPHQRFKFHRPLAYLASAHQRKTWHAWGPGMETHKPQAFLSGPVMLRSKVTKTPIMSFKPYCKPSTNTDSWPNSSKRYCSSTHLKSVTANLVPDLDTGQIWNTFLNLDHAVWDSIHKMAGVWHRLSSKSGQSLTGLREHP